MKLIWSDESFADRMAIFDYIAANNIDAARKLNAMICERAESLVNLPFLGRTGKVPGTRELTVHPSCRLVYEIDGETIAILRVIHASRNWPQD